MNKDYLPGERRLSSAEHALQPDVNKKELVDDKIDMHDAAKKDQPTRPARLGNFLYALTDGVILKQEHVTKFLEKRDAKKAERRAKKLEGKQIGRHAVNNATTEVIPRIKDEAEEVAPILRIPTLEDLNKITAVQTPPETTNIKTNTGEFPVNTGYRARHSTEGDTQVIPRVETDDHQPAAS